MARAVFYHPPIKNMPLMTVPLAFLHLATPLKGGRHDIELVDGRLEVDPIEALLGRLAGADVLLISAMPGSQIATGLQACAAAREAHPNLHIYWGGPHPSVDPVTTIASPLASGVVIGRGEFTIEAILDCLESGQPPSAIPNVLYKDAAGDVRRGPCQSFASRKPHPPDFALLASVEPYICQTRRSHRMLDYISSFGCPHRCTFCSEPITSGSRWSGMDADVLVAEIRLLVERYAIDGIMFQDAKFVTDRQRLVQFCTQLIKQEIGVNWLATICSTDVARFEQEGILQLMHDSGCEQVFIGAEAASGETLKRYKKTVEGEETYQIAKLLWEKYDILPHFSYIIGHPMESLEQVRKTLHLHRSVCELVGAPTGELGLYNPVAGTPFAAESAHHFHIPTDLDGWARFNYMDQELYKRPSAELDRVLFQHHIRLRRLFSGVEHHKTYDVWQATSN